MAKDTNIDLRNEIIYSVYVRNHSEEGTFVGIENDLDRIKKKTLFKDGVIEIISTPIIIVAN